MRRICALMLLLTVGQIASAECYELSKDGVVWDAEPYTLCVEVNKGGTSEFRLTVSKAGKDIAIYNLNSTPGGADVLTFGIDPMRGSFLNDSIRISIGYGEVTIGQGKYFYRE